MHDWRIASDGHLQFVEHSIKQQPRLAPVKLEGLAQIEAQRLKGPG